MNRLKQMPVVSVLLVVSNVCLYFLSRFFPEMIYRNHLLTVDGVLGKREYDRMIWAMFLHADVNHLFNNMIILFFLGMMLEKELGSVRFGMAYFFSGIVGNIFSLVRKVFKNQMAGTLGASGAVFGMDGVLLALVIFSNRKIENITLPRVCLMIALSLYSGFSGTNVDNAAHLGGLIAGFFIGGVMCVSKQRKKTA